MSRVDDDRQQQRIAQELALKRQQEEQRNKERAQGESAFARLVDSGRRGAAKAQGTADQQRLKAEHELHSEETEVADELLEGALTSDDAKLSDARSRRSLARLAKGSFDDQLKKKSGHDDDEHVDAERTQVNEDDLGKAFAGADNRAGEGRLRGRRQDAEVGDRGLKERGEAMGAASAHAAQGRGGPEDKTKADADGGGGKGQGGSGNSSGSDVPANFRLNPALMAPVPVAKPKDTAGSERLRRLANEIAQKIVERVRVGKNSAGNAEFQIDLRSNVLSGLSIKLSGSNGKIKAVFSGNDRQVLKMLKEQAESLRGALAQRGLKLEEFRIEERA